MAGCTVGFPATKAKLAGVQAQADVATVDYTVPGGDWGVAGSARILALVQEIVYTATEEPGIRRALITQNGGQRAVIGGEGLIVDKPLAREDVLGYRLRASTDPVNEPSDSGIRSSATTRFSVDEVAPGLARFVIELRASGAPARWLPSINVSVRENREVDDPQAPAKLRGEPDMGKWLLTIGVNGATDPQVPVDQTTYQLVGPTPLRAIAANANQSGVAYMLVLDDLRPWRVGYLIDPVRIVVDLGGPTQCATANLAVYDPLCSTTYEVRAGSSYPLSGLARAFEANVPWRLKDSSGRVIASGATTATIGTSPIWGAFETMVAIPANASGALTLELLQASAKDGSITDLVAISLRVR